MITPEQKATFLQHIRDGNDRATAAFLTDPELTGTAFKRLCNESSTKYYDPEFATAYAEAVAERGAPDRERAVKVRSETRESRHLRHNGFVKANYLTDEQLAHFCELVSGGLQAALAARELDPPTSITQIHRRVARDPDFARAFEQAKQEGLHAYQEELRGEARRQAFNGDYRALKDQMLIYLPEALEKLTTQRHEHGAIDIRVFAEQHLQGMSPEQIEAMIHLIEEAERPALPAPS